MSKEDVRFGVVTFPGANCEQDSVHALRHLGFSASYLWHGDTNLSDYDAIVLPGGFSYGDYLRCGAIARFSPVMTSVIEAAQKGMPVIGICNGFQVLTEAHLLPGALMRNRDLKFICKSAPLLVEDSVCGWHDLKPKTVIELPIAHGEGNYICDEQTLASLEKNRQIVLRYCSASGELDEAHNPNGSVGHIAGICNKAGNIFGLMPHPERVVDGVSGSSVGAHFFAQVATMVGARE